MNEPADMRFKLFCLFSLVAVALRISFWIYTDRIWEDALITVRHAENFAAGKGLTHHPSQGSPIHGFTSAISVLIPLLGELAWSGTGIITQKLFSIVASVLAIYLAYCIAIHPSIQLSIPSLAFLLGFLAIDHQQILFGMAGMETQCVVAISLLVLCLAVYSQWNWLGGACGLALWARPDGIVLVFAMLVCVAIKQGVRQAMVTGTIALLCFSPWLVFTTTYYGSPIPHTIVAKNAGYLSTIGVSSDDKSLLDKGTTWLSTLSGRFMNLKIWLAPCFAGCGGGAVNQLKGARVIQLFYGVVVLIGVTSALNRRKETFFVAAAAIAMTGYFWFILPQIAGWYAPPWLAFLAIAYGIGADQIRNALPGKLQLTVCVATTALLGYYTYGLTKTFPAERVIQSEIENPVRKGVGLWLAEHTKETDWVAAECLGYIGYYSNRPILDYPGLACPRSVARLKKTPGGMLALFAAEQPEWMVLREHEAKDFQERFAEIAANYVVRHEVKATDLSLEKLDRFLGLSDRKISSDRHFLVFERVSAPD